MGSLTNDAIVKFICNIPKNINIAIYVIKMEKLSRSLYGNIISVNRFVHIPTGSLLYITNSSKYN